MLKHFGSILEEIQRMDPTKRWIFGIHAVWYLHCMYEKFQFFNSERREVVILSIFSRGGGGQSNFLMWNHNTRMGKEFQTQIHLRVNYKFLSGNFSMINVDLFLSFRWQLPGHPTVRTIVPHQCFGLYGRLGKPGVLAAHLCQGPGGRNTQHLLCKTSHNLGNFTTNKKLCS